MLSVFEFILLGLATFRLARLFVYDQITTKFRLLFQMEEENVLHDGTVEIIISGKGTGIRRFIGELLACHWCVSVWFSVILYGGLLFFPFLFTPIVIIFSVAAISGIVQTITNYFI
ncbi:MULTISPECIES: DUF1360 domain-containing protein [Paraliobacillus]|uniref:DUF1360 domain-containing protein n=1 Tax=Paraliobacillus TaxID=200903 RepID=UPI000DD33C51|nr:MULTISPECIES: DUF1360 domain-containing protein [Paraliobacillus]